MKNLFKIFSLVLLFGFISTACEDSTTEMATYSSIYELTASDPDLSNLKAAIDKAGLASTLNQSGNFTVFAPSNAAFSQFLSANGFASLNDVPTAALKEILLNHVLGTKMIASQVATGYVSTMAKGSASSTRNLSMFVNTASGVKLNGVSTVTQPDLMATNGLMHHGANVIGLTTVATHVLANPTFSTLVSALTRNDMPDFVGIRGGSTGSPFTVLAPNNAAFGSLLTEINLPGLASIPTVTLENALKYHVVAGANVASTDIMNNMNVTTFQGGTFTVTTTGGVKITDANNRMSNVIATDVQCSNGIIHVLDKVLLP